MVEYILIAISFAIVVQVRYLFEVNAMVKDMIVVLELENESYKFSPIVFNIVWFILSTIAMPLMALIILSNTKDDIVKDISTRIMERYFDVDFKK